MAEAETADIMVRAMNNIDLVLIAAAAGFLAQKITGRNKNQFGM